MDYHDLLNDQPLDDLREMAECRDIPCSYLSNGNATEDNRDVIVKTLLVQLESEDNIARALSRLSHEDHQLLRQVVQTGKDNPESARALSCYGFYLTDDKGNACWPDALNSALKDLEPVQCGVAGPEEASASGCAYAAYLMLLNGFLMRKLKCLTNQQPGKRMAECLCDRLPVPVSADNLTVLHEFLVGTGLLLESDRAGIPAVPAEIVDAPFFYTNLFKYLLSGEAGAVMEQIGHASEGEQPVVLDRIRMEIDEPLWQILIMADAIKPLTRNTFVMTDLLKQFMTDKAVSPSDVAEGDASFYVVPGFRMIVDRHGPTGILNTLIRIAQLEQFDQVYQFGFNTCSLIHAHKQGFSETDIIGFLETHAPSCPDDLKRLIQDTFARYGEVKIFSGYQILCSDQPAILEKIRTHEEVHRYIHADRDGQLILDHAKDPREIQRLLMEMDYIPELDINHNHRLIHREDMAEITRFLSLLRKRLKKSSSPESDALNALFEKLRIEPEVPDESPEDPASQETKQRLQIENQGTMGLDDRMEILQFAMSQGYRIRVQYKQKGTDHMEDRLLTPRYFDGDFLVAYCDNRKAERRFNVYRLALSALILED